MHPSLSPGQRWCYAGLFSACVHTPCASRSNPYDAFTVRQWWTWPAIEPLAGGRHMAKLIIDFISSLDGYAAADGWPGWWGKEGREYLAWLGEQPEANYTVLMGANTYRLMSGLATEG